MRHIKLIFCFLLFNQLVVSHAWGENASNQMESPASDTIVQMYASESTESLLDKAASAYAARKYDIAIDIYEYLLEKYGVSANVYYNLGNAYFKNEKMAQAILNYERSMKLNPGDADTKHNLELCKTKIVDQITPLGKFIFARWYQSLYQSFSSNWWSIFGIVSAFIFSICLACYFLGRKRWIKKTCFFVGVLAMIFAIFGIIFANKSYQKVQQSDEAILFSLSVTAKSSPDQSGNDLFVLHEGVKVVIKSQLGDWCEVELEDGNVGWLQMKDLVII